MRTGFKIKRHFKKTSRFLKNKFHSFNPLLDIINLFYPKKDRIQIANKTLLDSVSWPTETFSELKQALLIGADINARRGNGKTVLMTAIRNGHVKSAKLLIKRGAGIDLQDNTGMTALMFASANKQIEIVKLLIKECADPLIKDKLGRTAYSLATDPTIVFTVDSQIKNMLLEYELKWRFDKIKTSAFKQIYEAIQECSSDKIYLTYQTL